MKRLSQSLKNPRDNKGDDVRAAKPEHQVWKGEKNPATNVKNGT